MFKVNNRNTRTRSEICSKLTLKTPELCHRRKVRTVFAPCSIVSIVNFAQINAGCAACLRFGARRLSSFQKSCSWTTLLRKLCRTPKKSSILLYSFSILKNTSEVLLYCFPLWPKDKGEPAEKMFFGNMWLIRKKEPTGGAL